MKATKFWNIVTENDGLSAELTLYGQVCGNPPRDWWTGEKLDIDSIALSELKNDIKSVKDVQNLTIRINSVGGEVFAGLAIHNLLKSVKAHKTVIVEGIAASAASVIMCAGDEVKVYPSSIVMIHNVSTFLGESVTIQDLEKYVNAMKSMEKATITTYQAKTGKKEKELQCLLDAETWMTGEEAVAMGFADTLIDGEMTNKLSIVASADGKQALKYGDITINDNFKAHIPSRFGINALTNTTHIKNMSEPQKTAVPTTEPAPINPVVNQGATATEEPKAPINETQDALAQERERITKINNLVKNGVISHEVAENAINDGTKTAEMLAYEACTNQNNPATNFLANREKETQAQNAVKTQPHSGDNTVDEATEFKNECEFFAGVATKMGVTGK